MLEKIKEFLFGPEPEKTSCPVCGGTMVERKTLQPDPYWDANFRCETCGAVCDGVTIRTDVPREEWIEDEE